MIFLNATTQPKQFDLGKREKKIQVLFQVQVQVVNLVCLTLLVKKDFESSYLMQKFLIANEWILFTCAVPPMRGLETDHMI